jgi:hypothetical protein
MLKAAGVLEKRNYSAALVLLVPLLSRVTRELSVILLTSVGGLAVTPDVNKAIELYVKVAEQSIREQHFSALAHHNLAIIYTNGALGVEPDCEKAQRHSTLAASELGLDM